MSVPAPSRPRPPATDVDADHTGSAREAVPSRRRRSGSGPDPAPRSGARSRDPGYAALVRTRIAAFGALAALVAAVVYLVATAGGSSSPPLTSVNARVAAHKPRNWIVRPGQTLSSIAAREHVSLTALERLNPQLIPASLASGQRVKLPG
jgi:hypothetical protein